MSNKSKRILELSGLNESQRLDEMSVTVTPVISKKFRDVSSAMQAELKKQGADNYEQQKFADSMRGLLKQYMSIRIERKSK